jgi:NAD(P)-dependent dehydrogenase (short-subunit alcohol dehydrogenase family)
MLKGKVAIITGGSCGIGRVIALLFAKEGAKVAIVARKNKQINRTLSEIKKINKEAMGIRADVSKQKEITRAVAGTIKKFKRIDILVNCAGIQAPIGPFAKNSLKEWIYNVEVNLFGTIMCCKAVLPEMMKRKSGKIINFSGGGATGPRPNFSAYAVAKTGVVRFTEILGEELKPYNVQVNAIAPGAVNTSMLKEILKAGKKAGKKELAAAKKRLKQGGTPPELAAELVLFLASGKAAGLTGRLISARWDDWKNWDKKKIKKIMQSEKYTLRRIK